MIRILLVDDQTLLCEVLKTWLEVEEDFEVIDVAHNGHEALSKIEILHPDIVLMDIDMPEMNGLNATQIISERFPNVKVIFLSGHDEDDYLGKSLRAGAKGYLLKNTTAEELSEKVRYVYNANNSEANGAQKVEGDMVAVVQTQLEELIETYRYKFQKQLEDVSAASTKDIDYTEQIHKLESSLNKQQKTSLEKIQQETKKLQQENKQLHLENKKIQQENQESWDALRQELEDMKAQFINANQIFSGKINQQIVNLRKDVDEELKQSIEDWSRERAALQEWAVQRDEMQVSAEEVQSRYRRELMSAVNPFRASFRDTDRQIRTMRNWLIGTVLLAAMSLTFSSWLLASNFVSNSNPSPETQVK